MAYRMGCNIVFQDVSQYRCIFAHKDWQNLCYLGVTVMFALSIASLYRRAPYLSFYPYDWDRGHTQTALRIVTPTTRHIHIKATKPARTAVSTTK